MKGRDRGAALALLLISAVALIGWGRDELYFSRLPTGGTVAAVIVNLLVVAAALGLLDHFLRSDAYVRATRTALVLALCVAGYEIARSAIPAFAHLARPLKIIGALMLLWASVWVSGRLGAQTWERLNRAVIFGTLAYAVAPAAASWYSTRDIAWPPISALGPDELVMGASPPSSNVIFILLDELGDTAAPPIVNALNRVGFVASEKSLLPAGADTINVIPSMFSRLDFGEAAPCGIAKICSGSHVLDFSRVTASRQDVDVIGLYHPYCRMSGLRYCRQLEGPMTFENPFLRLLNVYASRLGRPLLDTDPEAVPGEDSKAREVSSMIESMMNAPFWRQGGVLYAHLPLPHPPALSGWHTLDADYAANLQSASNLIEKIAIEAHRSFGDDVRIIVTADHPLRPRIWCSDSPFNPYRGQGCHVRAEFLTHQVPLITVGVSPAAAKRISSNRDAFDAMASPAVARRPAGTSSASGPR